MTATVGGMSEIEEEGETGGGRSGGMTDGMTGGMTGEASGEASGEGSSSSGLAPSAALWTLPRQPRGGGRGERGGEGAGGAAVGRGACRTRARAWWAPERRAPGRYGITAARREGAILLRLRVELRAAVELCEALAHTLLDHLFG